MMNTSEGEPWVLVIKCTNHIHKIGPAGPGVLHTVYADEALAVIMDEGKEIGFLLPFYL